MRSAEPERLSNVGKQDCSDMIRYCGKGDDDRFAIATLQKHDEYGTEVSPRISLSDKE